MKSAIEIYRPLNDHHIPLQLRHLHLCCLWDCAAGEGGMWFGFCTGGGSLIGMVV